MDTKNFDRINDQEKNNSALPEEISYVSSHFHRRAFLRSLGLSAGGVMLSKFGFSMPATAAGAFSPAPLKQLKRYYGHDAVLDKNGVIAPWFNGVNGQCDFRVRIAAETLKRYPWTTAESAIAVYPDYLFTSKWKISEKGAITPVNPGDWMNADLGQRTVSVLLSMVQYYRYSGDAAAIAHMTYMGNFLIDHCLTSEEHSWPKFPISVPTKGKAYGKPSEEGMIQLDICGSIGGALLKAYQVTGIDRWFESAKHWGDLFAQNCNFEESKAPWNRYTNPENTYIKWRTDPRGNLQTGGVTMILSFLDELIRLGYTGKDGSIIKARDAGVSYVKNYLLPNWIKDDTWAYYFWDWINDVQNCSTTADATSYMLNNKHLFPNWKNDVRNILTIFLNRTSADENSKGDVYNGAWAYPESSDCCGTSLWYAPLMDGAIMAQYGVEAGNDLLKEIAYRSMVLQTYDVFETGVSHDNLEGGELVNGEWLNIAHPWPLLWVLTAMGWLPEELGASRENHLVRTTSVVRFIQYTKGKIAYTTYDAPENTIEVLRLSFEPKEITANGKKLALQSQLKSNGYLVKKLPNGDTIVTIRHDGSTEIVVRGNDLQSIVAQKNFTYAGNWKKDKDKSAYSGILNSASAHESSVSIAFQGNQVRLLGKIDEAGGLADIYIDDEQQLVHLDCWSPSAKNIQTLYYRNGLSEGNHVLKIVARGSGNPYSKGSAVYIDAALFSNQRDTHHFPVGTGPTETQRMIFGYPQRTDYKDSAGNSWRPATEIVSRLGVREDTVVRCWWMKPANEIKGTADTELYKYGYHAKEFWLNVTVKPAKYDVRLKFAAARAAATNKSRFDVFINGKPVLQNLDVQAEAGENNALDKIFKGIESVSGIIEIRFKSSENSKGDAFVQAIEVGQNLS